MSNDELRRRRENEDLLVRMRQGDNLCHTDIGAFKWAPRPTIKKDAGEMLRIYGECGVKQPNLRAVDVGGD